MITTGHKQNYVRVFLKDFLASRQGTKMKVGDVGAATGYLLNFFRGLGHEVSGSELTLTYRRMSEHYYGIPLAEELEAKHRYDLIVIYHVLEHLVEPDKKLAHYASLLAEGGRILVATPEWFNYLEDASGQAAKSFDELFHKNHINLFSATSIQNLFRKAGLRAVKEDHLQYGQTYLLERDPGPRNRETQITKEDWREVLRVMLLHEKGIRLYTEGKLRDAYELVPKFPEAWLAMIFGRCAKDLAKQQDLIQEAEKHIGETARFLMARGHWYYQQGRLAEALADYGRVAAVKPNEDLFMFIGYAHAQAGRTRDAINCMQIAQSMDPRKWAEAQQWILNAVSQMPTWDERALGDARQALKIEPPKLAEVAVR